MSKTQCLLFLVLLIPLINIVCAKLCAKSHYVINFINKAFPVIFFMNLFGFLSVDNINASLLIFPSSTLFSFGFTIDKMSLLFLCLLNFIWLIFAFYASSFAKLCHEQHLDNISFVTAVIILFLVLIVVSHNILTMCLFYMLLLFSGYKFATTSLIEEGSTLHKIITYLLCFQAICLCLALLFTGIFAGDHLPILSSASHLAQTNIIFLYLGALFLMTLTPFYVVLRHFHFNLSKTYMLFFLALGFSSLYILMKILLSVFGFALSESGVPLLESIFLINLCISSYQLLASKTLKSTFLHIFFNQLNFTVFTIFIFAASMQSKIELPLISFTLSITLLFMCFSNIVIYLQTDEKSDLGIVSKAIFGELRVTCMLLIFAILNLIGIVPGLGMFEKFFLIKAVSNEGSYISEMIFTLNFLTLLAFAGKIFYPLFDKATKPSIKESELSKTIDSDSGLMLTSLITAIITLLLPIVL
jgi:formate hydrogenlyase subunit 3/multisubunit Na+/H+ antiporter MnhD subunit